ncbi:hypothetical protein RhiJN_27130 [Ceratobasidium sp. AG-Ba]|nr:hypothetical protein RhiJN_27130 [Ceratobasidium sp. AG-Ba]
MDLRDIHGYKSRRLSTGVSFVSRFDRLNLQDRETSVKNVPAGCAGAPFSKPTLCIEPSSSATNSKALPRFGLGPGKNTKAIDRRLAPTPEWVVKLRARLAHPLVGGVGLPDKKPYDHPARAHARFFRPGEGPFALTGGARGSGDRRTVIVGGPSPFTARLKPKAGKGKTVAFSDTDTIFEIPAREPEERPSPSRLQEGQDASNSFMDEDWNARDRTTSEILAHRPYLAKIIPRGQQPIQSDTSSIFGRPKLKSLPDWTEGTVVINENGIVASKCGSMLGVFPGGFWPEVDSGSDSGVGSSKMAVDSDMAES